MMRSFMSTRIPFHQLVFLEANSVRFTVILGLWHIPKCGICSEPLAPFVLFSLGRAEAEALEIPFAFSILRWFSSQGDLAEPRLVAQTMKVLCRIHRDWGGNDSSKIGQRSPNH
jgi:hypothetical protein